MKVQIHLLGELSRFTNGPSHFEMILYYNDTVIDVLRKLKMPDSELFSIFINNKLVIRQRVILNEGDKIVFLPVVGGG